MHRAVIPAWNNMKDSSTSSCIYFFTSSLKWPLSFKVDVYAVFMPIMITCLATRILYWSNSLVTDGACYKVTVKKEMGGGRGGLKLKKMDHFHLRTYIIDIRVCVDIDHSVYPQV